ncbi:hypothetical protein EV13_1608 [Prochlorococcus sp. MIT 0702]|nr:hypothetical protein EV13_1608 [Prochlorococcus sp. MIT 0702]KGG28672.1 hypothetical protein EV12_0567 [Prochlorococcus sp. MIT 0701]KGG36316.1 hypothetical protein EV14_0410 [Prochlorococcus sp. MIT 0703]
MILGPVGPNLAHLGQCVALDQGLTDGRVMLELKPLDSG